MFEQAFKRIDDTLRKDAGVSSELDYIEQTSWILFLKYLDALEDDRATQAELDGRKFSPLLEPKFRWAQWAVPRTADGRTDHARTLVGDDLRNFVDQELFPYLRNFKTRAADAQTLEYKVGEIFGEIKNKLQSGYNLREILEEVDTLRFNSQQEKHELSDLYEAKIRNMGNAGRNGGEYYTPRPLIRAMLAVIQPKIGETIYDGALGSAGFLCEAFELLRKKPNLTTTESEILQKRTFYGQEKKPLAYVIGLMNMILHGIDAPNVVHVNTLEINLNDIEERDRHDIILANPPFGSKERLEVQQNFSIKTAETAFLFLQHFIRKLRAGGRAAVVIKNTFLSNSDAATLRRKLLEDCDLHTILDCPANSFSGSNVRTVVLFFTKGRATQKIWYYELQPGRSLGKTNPLNDADLADFVTLQNNQTTSAKSWTIDRSAINQRTFNLSVKNPNGAPTMQFRHPRAILDEIQELDLASAGILLNIRKLV